MQSPIEDMKSKHDCDFLIFFGGRLTPEKNLMRFIKALSNVDTEIRYKFIIAGKGELTALLKKKIKDLNLESNVELVGWVSNDDVNLYFCSADLLAYITINEPFGLIPIEGMARGKPSIVASFGGPSETVIDGSTGFHVNPFNTKEISNKLNFIFEDPARLRKMEGACKKRSEYFTCGTKC